MAIKARTNNNPNAVCCECGDGQAKVLNMFDLCIGGTIFTLCDRCNEALLNKTLSAECYTNGRVKSPRDLSIVRSRRHGTYKKDGGHGTKDA